MNTSFKISSGFLFIIFLVSLLAPWVAPYSYQEQDTLNILAFPGIDHFLGTDRLGRDLLSRMIYGARVSLFVGVFLRLLHWLSAQYMERSLLMSVEKPIT